MPQSLTHLRRHLYPCHLGGPGIEKAREQEQHALQALRGLDAPLAEKQQYMDETAQQQQVECAA